MELDGKASFLDFVTNVQKSNNISLETSRAQSKLVLIFLKYKKKITNNINEDIVYVESLLVMLLKDKSALRFEDNVSGFINKVEEQIQGFYVQALAVPGAVILSSTLRDADKGISLSLIFSAFLAVIIVFTSLNSKTKFINRITENTLKKLNIYQKRTDDIENSSAKEIISEKINDAINSVKNTCMESKQDIFKMRDIIIAMGAMYLIAIVLTGQF